MVRWLVGALGACCLTSLPACSDPAAPTPAEVNLPVDSLAYVRPVPQDLSGPSVDIGRFDLRNQVGNGGQFTCRMHRDGATFLCGLPVTLLANTDYWVRVDDPARTHATADARHLSDVVRGRRWHLRTEPERCPFRDPDIVQSLLQLAGRGVPGQSNGRGPLTGDRPLY